MHLILSFLVMHFADIWKDGAYCISSSQNSRVNGGNAVLVVESPRLRLRFTCDRGQLMVDLQSPFGSDKVWFDASLLWPILREVSPKSGLLDENLAELLIAELPAIEDMMRAEALAESYSSLKRARAQRTRELFG